MKHCKSKNSREYEIADELLNRHKWEETTNALNFKKSNRKSWSLLKKLGNSNPIDGKKPEMRADQFAARVVKLSKVPGNKQQDADIQDSTPSDNSPL